MKNNNIQYINGNENNIGSKLNQKFLQSCIIKEDRIPYDIKSQSLYQNQDKKQQKKIIFISEAELFPSKQQHQTNELYNNIEKSQQQQLVLYLDSNQKNTQQKYEEEKFLTQRTDISNLKFESNLDETIILTQIFSCYQCLSSLKINNIALPCFHLYHQECFKEMVDIFLKQEYSESFYCRCKIRIPFKTLIKQFSNDPKIVEDLLIHQQAWLILNAPLKIQNQITEKNRNISNIKQYIIQQIRNYKASLIKK
ncbi:unnamed protein product [Paramecium pentaurelia]|uniref:RING-type domain-containing protein n=1 Tax=Paramecium pentaurelia TaxID=43138 RepID=A0A8S1XF71_9CILI|nr:unnamed protein product [Paramecium pentaurelia]